MIYGHMQCSEKHSIVWRRVLLSVILQLKLRYNNCDAQCCSRPVILHRMYLSLMAQHALHKSQLICMVPSAAILKLHIHCVLLLPRV